MQLIRDDNHVPVPVGQLSGTYYNIDGSGGTAAHTDAFTSDELVRIRLDADGAIAIGASATATANTCKMTSGIPEYFGVGAGERVSVLGAVANISVMR